MRSTSVAGLIQQAAGRLEQRVSEIATEIADLIATAMDPPVDLESEEYSLLAESATGQLVMFIAAVRTGVPFADVPVPEPSVRWARTIAAEGQPSDALMRAFQLAQAAFHDVWHRELVASGAPAADVLDALREFMRLSFAWVDTMTRPLVVEHALERQRQTRDAASVRAGVVASVLAREEVEADLASARLGYDLKQEHRALITWTTADKGAPSALTLDNLLAAVAEVTGTLRGGSLAIYDTGNVLWLWLGRGATSDAVLSNLSKAVERAPVHLAAGSPGFGVSGFRRSHEEARQASRVARLLHMTRPIVSYADVAVLDLMTRDPDAARDLARAHLGPLAADTDSARRIRETLRVFFEEGSSHARTARRLGIPPNTIASRVARAVELTGAKEPWSDLLRAAVQLSPLVERRYDPRP